MRLLLSVRFSLSVRSSLLVRSSLSVRSSSSTSPVSTHRTRLVVLLAVAESLAELAQLQIRSSSDGPQPCAVPELSVS